MRGFVTSCGVANLSKASNMLLKDYVNVNKNIKRLKIQGKLTYVHPPPDIDELSFNNFVEIKRMIKASKPCKSEAYQKQMREKILKMSNVFFIYIN